MQLTNYVRAVPDFPKPGILFRDITPLLSNSKAFQTAIDQLADRYRDKDIDAIVAAESRGFIFGTPLALALDAAFIPVRKPGKLPAETHSHSYDLEYGSDTLEIHADALEDGQRVLVLDDLLATGGTIEACLQLLNKFSVEIVECAFIIQLLELEGHKKLEPHSVYSLLQY